MRDPGFAFVLNSMFIDKIATVKKLWHSFGLQFPVMLFMTDKTGNKTKKKATVLSTILTVTVVLFEKNWFNESTITTVFVDTRL